MSNPKWQVLGGKQEPPFDEKVVIWIPVKANADGYWQEAWLDEVVEKASGKTYIFKNGDNTYENASHFILLTPP